MGVGTVAAAIAAALVGFRLPDLITGGPKIPKEADRVAKMLGKNPGKFLGTSFLGIGAMGATFEGLGGIDALPITPSAPVIGALKFANAAVNSGVEWSSGMMSGAPVEHGQTLGDLIREFLSREKEPIKIAPLKVEVEVEVHNGNITAAVNDKNSREARRH